MKKTYVLITSMLMLHFGCKENSPELNAVSETNTNEILITKKQFEGEEMAFDTLSEQSFNKVIKTTGTIDVPPENKSSISTFVGGYITKIPLLIGDKVTKNQFVATLESTEIVEIQQQYLEISEQLSFLKNEYDRQKTLFDEQITSQKNYLKAESTYKSSLATFNGLRKKLQMLNINPTAVEKGQITSSINLYAPISGYVTKVNVSNGTYVSSASELMEIVNTDHIHLELTVFEKDILQVKKNQSIHFKIPEASKTIYNAEVYLVGTTINSKRTITIHGHIKDKNQTNFIVGMFVEADIITETEQQLALPNSAIAKVDDDYFTLVLKEKSGDNMILEKVKLTLGNTNEDYSQVLNMDQLKDKSILINGGLMLLSE